MHDAEPYHGERLKKVPYFDPEKAIEFWGKGGDFLQKAYFLGRSSGSRRRKGGFGSDFGAKEV